MPVILSSLVIVISLNLTMQYWTTKIKSQYGGSKERTYDSTPYFGAQVDWTSDCHHLFCLTATEFIKVPYSLLLPPLEHKFEHRERSMEKVAFFFLDIKVIHCRNISTQLLLLGPCSLPRLGGFFADSHLISIKQLQFQNQKPPAHHLRTPNYTWNTLPGLSRFITGIKCQVLLVP